MLRSRLRLVVIAAERAPTDQLTPAVRGLK
jgi:hypothetical protein